MIKWIVQNKEWLFSGAGVTAILLIGGLIARAARRKAKPSVPMTSLQTKDGQAQLPEVKYVLRPLPAEIRDQIESAPVLSIGNRAKEFVGLMVKWKVTLYSAHLSVNGRIDLMLLDRGNYPWVVCSVRKSDYPELSIARVGTGMWVMGSIEKFESNTFYLGQVKLDINIK